MRRVTINGETYALPFFRLFREHTDIESRELTESIRNIWIQVPVVVYTSPTHGRAVIDGIGRANKALEIDADKNVPIKDYGHISDADAEAIARHLNKRRHLTPEELKEIRETELKRIPELRKAGMSLRAIAKEVREDVATVHRTLRQELVESSTSDDENDDIFDDEEEAGYHPATWVELENDAVANGEYQKAAEYRRKGIEARRREYTETPARIVGRDGKSYPASTPRRTEPANEELLEDVKVPGPQDAIFEKLTKLFEYVRIEYAALRKLDEPIRKKLKRMLMAHRDETTAIIKSMRLAGKRA